jgi:hypothetical protein
MLFIVTSLYSYGACFTADRCNPVPNIIIVADENSSICCIQPHPEAHGSRMVLS